jgi:hypothetical protein
VPLKAPHRIERGSPTLVHARQHLGSMAEHYENI